MSEAEPSYVSELYSAYAAGRLSPAYALMVETQTALRADIRRDVEIAESISGAMLENETPEPMSPRAFETALKAIATLPAQDPETLQAAKAASSGLEELLELPEPLCEKALQACQQGGWQRLTGGVSRLDLGKQKNVQAHLYRIEPGASVPTHSHKGEELTLVVAGGFTDQFGSYGPGDISRQTPTHTHRPVADDDGVCMALAVSEGGLKFTGVLGLLQKIARR